MVIKINTKFKLRKRKMDVLKRRLRKKKRRKKRKRRKVRKKKSIKNIRIVKIKKRGRKRNENYIH